MTVVRLPASLMPAKSRILNPTIGIQTVKDIVDCSLMNDADLYRITVRAEIYSKCNACTHAVMAWENNWFDDDDDLEQMTYQHFADRYICQLTTISERVDLDELRLKLYQMNCLIAKGGAFQFLFVDF